MEITDPLGNTRQLTATDPATVSAKRLDVLLAANAAIARHKKLYPTRQTEIEVLTMRHPLDMPRAFSYLGLMLGLFPPATLFGAFLTGLGSTNQSGGFAFLLLMWVTFVTSAVGYFLGRIVGGELAKFEGRSFNFLLLATVIAGFLWGAASGAVGGVFIFIFGLFFGAAIGGVVGAIALPVFYLFRSLVKSGKMIELRHFLPIAFGTTFSICALILHLLS